MSAIFQPLDQEIGLLIFLMPIIAIIGLTWLLLLQLEYLPENLTFNQDFQTWLNIWSVIFLIIIVSLLLSIPHGRVAKAAESKRQTKTKLKKEPSSAISLLGKAVGDYFKSFTNTGYQKLTANLYDYYETSKNFYISPVEFVQFENDSFLMGSNSSTSDPDEQPIHQVYLSPFSISKYEVTNIEYYAYLKSAFQRGELTFLTDITRGFYSTTTNDLFFNIDSSDFIVTDTTTGNFFIRNVN